MRQLPGVRRAPLVALGVVAVLAAGGGAYAATSNNAGTITACVQHGGGTIYRARHCARHDQTLRWNAIGRRGATGSRGPIGPPGIGTQGPAGPTASSVASATPNPATAIDPIAFSDVLSTTVTTTASSQVIGNASIEVQPAFGTPTVACQIKVDGAFIGAAEQTKLSSTADVVIAMSQGEVVSAGSHLVAIACQQTVGAAGAVFAAGNITAIATAA
jgi:hypothetical protein